METVRISQEINPHFYGLWTTDKPYVVAKGGRGSFKSSTISLKLVTNVLKYAAQGHKANVVCIRENQSYLRDSVFNQVMWAAGILHVSDEFKPRTSPMTITHIPSGSTFYFYGANYPEKLKSNIVGNVIAVWFEEFANFKNIDAYDQSLPTFIRQKPAWLDHVTTYCSYNPPRNPYSWVNEWIKQAENDTDYYVDTSTYLDDELGFTTKQQLDLIKQYKDNDPDYYNWLYLGKVIGLGNNVYNMDLFHAALELPTDDPLQELIFGMDVGHEVSATSVVALGQTLRGKVCLLDTWYYSPAGKANKMPPSEQAIHIHDFVDKVSREYSLDPFSMVIDSAEGALDNQYFAMYGVHWQKVHKLKEVDMIDRVQDLLAQGRFYYLDIPDNEIFIEEHKNYRWDENTLNSDDPHVIKEDDHTVDAFKYAVLTNERELGLRW